MIVDGFSKSSTEMVIGEINEYKGKRYAHLRIVQPSVEEGEFVRTKKGVSIEVDRFHMIRDGVHRLQDLAAPRVVARIQKGRDEIRVLMKEFNSNILLDVRQFFQGNDQEWHPTQKGISVRTDRLDDLIDLVDRVQKAIEEGEA